MHRKTSTFRTLTAALLMALAMMVFPAQSLLAQERDNAVAGANDRVFLQAKANFKKAARISINYESVDGKNVQIAQVGQRVFAQVHARMEAGNDALIVSCGIQDAKKISNQKVRDHGVVPCSDAGNNASDQYFSNGGSYVRRVMFDDQGVAQDSTLMVNFSYL